MFQRYNQGTAKYQTINDDEQLPKKPCYTSLELYVMDLHHLAEVRTAANPWGGGDEQPPPPLHHTRHTCCCCCCSTPEDYTESVCCCCCCCRHTPVGAAPPPPHRRGGCLLLLGCAGETHTGGSIGHQHPSGYVSVWRVAVCVCVGGRCRAWRTPTAGGGREGAAYLPQGGGEHTHKGGCCCCCCCATLWSLVAG